ncbi:MAG TPA: FG-GAP-like repeat-containing protein [Edaphobacter sp.]
MCLNRDSLAQLHSSIAVLILSLSLGTVAKAITPTSTTLTLLPSASISVGNPVTLSATVTAAGRSVHPGTIVFCNANAPRCEDSAILGQAQLTNAGSAQIHLRLGVGTYRISAKFQGTPHGATALASSFSTPVILTVTGGDAASAMLTSSGVAGNFQLTGTLIAHGAPVPTGTFSFVDRTGGNAVIGSVPLTGTKSLEMVQAALPDLFNGSQFNHVTNAFLADFNGDGIPDLVASTYSSAGNYITVLLGNGDGTFTTKSNPGVGISSGVVAVADVNNDGKLDLVVAFSNNFSINFNTFVSLLGNGDGTFQPPANAGSSLVPTAVAVADLNGDGTLDLAMVLDEFGSSQVLTLLNIGPGSGSFGVFGGVSGFQNANGIVAGDFNKDGKIDLAVSDGTANTVTILLGDGTGQITKGMTYSVGASPTTIVEADFNSDGIPDLAVPNSGDSTVSILLGNGDGTFTVQPPRAVGITFSTLAVGDFNGDGIPDLAVGGLPSKLLLGKGDGTFTDGVQFNFTEPIPDQPVLATADLNGDGLTDVITQNYSFVADWTVAATAKGLVLSGAGEHQVVASYSGDDSYSPAVSAPVTIANTTATPVLHPGPKPYTSVQMVTATDRTPGAIVYYTLDGSTPTNRSTPFTAPVRATGQTVIKAIAFSPNAAPSAVLVDTYVIQLPPPTINPSSGSYLAPRAITITPDPSCTTLTCSIYYTLDGTTPTVSSTRYTGPFTFTTLGSATVKAMEIAPDFVASKTATAAYTIVSATQTALSVVPGTTVSRETTIALSARVTNNGVPLQHGRVVFCNAAAARCEDAAAFGEAQIAANGTATLHLRLGEGAYSIEAVFQGTPHTTIPQARSVSTPSQITVTGAEPTQTPPAIVGIVSGKYYFRNTIAAFGRPIVSGTVSFFDSVNGGSPVSLGSVPINPRQSAVGFTVGSAYRIGVQLTTVATGDFNNDGIPDVIVADSELNAFWVLLGNGDGTFTTLPIQNLTYQPDVVQVGDFNSDGIQDIAITRRNNNDNSIEILLGNGDGTFTVSAVQPTGRGPQDFVIGDFNGDGIPDIVTDDLDGQTMTVLLGKGDGTFLSHSRITIPGLSSIAVGDFNGDGALDIATTDSADNGVMTLEVRLGDGTGNFSPKAPLVVPSDTGYLKVADFNGDGIPDLVSSFETVTVFLGKGDGTFQMQSLVSAVPAVYYQGISVADFNGDGKTDFMVSKARPIEPPPYYDEDLLVFLSNGDGTFTQRTFTQRGNFLSATADFNGDGVPDLVFPTGNAAGSTVVVELGYQAFKSAVTDVTLQGGASHSISIKYSGSPSYLPSASKAVIVTPP